MPGDVGLEAYAILDLLASLTDRSLVVPDQDSHQARSRLLETVRQYSLELLNAQGEAVEIRNRHCDYFARFAETAAEGIIGPEQVSWMQGLQAEHENIRAALEWSLSGGPPENGLRICASLVHYWHRQGHLAEGRQWCNRVLSTETGKARNAARAAVLNTAGMLAWMQGDYAAAHASYSESYEIASGLGRGLELCQALYGLGHGAFGKDDYATSRALYEEAHEIAVELGDKYLIAHTEYFAGIVLRIQGDYEGAFRAYKSTIAILREIGDRMGLSYPLYDIGLAYYYLGDFEPAGRFHEESLAIRTEAQDRWGMAESLHGLGLVALGKGNLQESEANFEASIAIARDLGDKAREAICLHYVGCIKLEQGDDRAAAARFSRALGLARHLDDHWLLTHSVGAAGLLAAFYLDGKTAMTLWAAEDHLREEMGSALPPVRKAMMQKHIEDVRAGSGKNDELDQAWNKGRELSLSEAVSLADDIFEVA